MAKKTIELLISELDLWTNLRNSDDIGTHKVPLSVRYSLSLNKWLAGYAPSGKKAVNKPENYGIGDTIYEALEDKLAKDKP